MRCMYMLDSSDFIVQFSSIAGSTTLNLSQHPATIRATHIHEFFKVECLGHSVLAVVQCILPRVE